MIYPTPLFSLQPRKQTQSILPINLLPRLPIHLVPLERLIAPLRLDGRVREITAIQHPLLRRPFEQRVQNIRTPAQCDIEIETLRCTTSESINFL